MPPRQGKPRQLPRRLHIVLEDIFYNVPLGENSYLAMAVTWDMSSGVAWTYAMERAF